MAEMHAIFVINSLVLHYDAVFMDALNYMSHIVDMVVWCIIIGILRTQNL